MGREFRILHTLAVLLVLLAACRSGTPAPTPTPEILRLQATSDYLPLLTLLANAYSARTPAVQVDLQSRGESAGINAVRLGQADIGLTAWPPDPLPDGLTLVPLLDDALAVIVHPDNTIDGLTMAELQDIFSGREVNWLAFDGPGRAIQVVVREDGSGDRLAFDTLAMAGRRVTPAAVVMFSAGQVGAYVARQPGAVGYVPARLVPAGTVIVPLEGMVPDDTLAEGRYPLTRTVSLVVPQNRGPRLEEFLRFVQGEEGQKIIATWLARGQ